MMTESSSVLPQQLPPWWKLLSLCRDGGAYVRSDELLVVSNVLSDDTGDQWLHVSLSRQGKTVTLRDLEDVKQNFIGPARLAVQVLPPEARCWAGLRCFHLWACLQGKPFPRFLRDPMAAP